MRIFFMTKGQSTCHKKKSWFHENHARCVQDTQCQVGRYPVRSDDNRSSFCAADRAFLASRESGYMTGAVLNMSGGAYMD